MWVLGVLLQSCLLLLGPYPCTTAVVYCVAVLRRKNRKKSDNCYCNSPTLTQPLPPRLKQQAKKEVEYEEVSVVVARGGDHCGIELKNNAAYGPVQRLA